MVRGGRGHTQAACEAPPPSLARGAAALITLGVTARRLGVCHASAFPLLTVQKTSEVGSGHGFLSFWLFSEETGRGFLCTL